MDPSCDKRDRGNYPRNTLVLVAYNQGIGPGHHRNVTKHYQTSAGYCIEVLLISNLLTMQKKKKMLSF